MTYLAYLNNYWIPTKAFSFISRLVRTASPVVEEKVFTELCNDYC